MLGDGINSPDLPRTISAVICRNGVTSSTHSDRPCVATTRSLAVVGCANSCTATVGNPVVPLIFDQSSPRLIEAEQVNSVPRESRFGFAMSSRKTRVEPIAKLALNDVHVSP